MSFKTKKVLGLAFYYKKREILVVSQVLLGKFKGTGLEMPFPY